MSAIDKVLRVDWSDADYLGDGVFAIRVDRDIAIRTDRGEENHVIVLEPRMLDKLNKFAERTKEQPGQQRPKSRFARIENFCPIDQIEQVHPSPETGEPAPEEENSTMEVRINASVGRIPVGATLEHHTHWLEMTGTHLSISLPHKSMEELNALGHPGRWILKRVEGLTSVVVPETVVPENENQKDPKDPESPNNEQTWSWLLKYSKSPFPSSFPPQFEAQTGGDETNGNPQSE